MTRTPEDQSPLSLGPAAAADAPGLAEVWRDGWHEAHDGRVPDALRRARTDSSFDQRAGELLPRALVARDGNGVAGFVATQDDEVDQLYVAPRQRGTGLAARLLHAAEDRIRSAGHDRAWLAVVADNQSARRFYRGQGWTDAGAFEHSAAGPTGTIAVPAHRYVKRLGAAAAPESSGPDHHDSGPGATRGD